MRLTQAMKIEFKNAVMSSLPTPAADAYREETDKVQKEVYALNPKDVIAFDKKYPGVVRRYEQSVKLQGSSGKYDFAYISMTPIVAERPGLREEIAKRLTPFWEACQEEQRKRRELAASVRQATEACTTLAALQKALPELVQFMPKGGGAKALTITTHAQLITDLMKAGLKTEPATA